MLSPQLPDSGDKLLCGLMELRAHRRRQQLIIRAMCDTRHGKCSRDGTHHFKGEWGSCPEEVSLNKFPGAGRR